MSAENPLAEENPFLKLDKTKFKSNPDTDKKKKRLQPPPPVVNPVPEPVDQGDLYTFLSAVRGATPLGAAPKPSARASRSVTPELENPVLGTTPAGRLSPKKNKAQTASPAEPNTEKPEALSKTAMTRSPSHTELSSDDTMHFSQAMKGVAPLSGKGREVLPEVPPPPVVMEPVESNPLQDFMDGKLEFALAFTDEYVEAHVIGLDLITVGKLQAGQFSPEAHIDLHGLNARQAFDALIGFFRSAYLKGQRTLLVVSGRGLNSPQGTSILKGKLQSWFTQEPFRRVILAFCTAKSADGGAGALYVLLRKFRKNTGKVYWERKPADPDLL